MFMWGAEPRHIAEARSQSPASRSCGCGCEACLSDSHPTRLARCVPRRCTSSRTHARTLRVVVASGGVHCRVHSGVVLLDVGLAVTLA